MRRILTSDGTTRASRMLDALRQADGRMVSRETLIAAMYPPGVEPPASAMVAPDTVAKELRSLGHNLLACSEGKVRGFRLVSEGDRDAIKRAKAKAEADAAAARAAAALAQAAYLAAAASALKARAKASAALATSLRVGRGCAEVRPSGRWGAWDE